MARKKLANKEPCTQEVLLALLSELGFSLNGSSVSLPLREGELGSSAASARIECLVTYLTLLSKWNAVMNLVGPSQWQDIVRTLVIDSFHVAAFLPDLGLAPQPECWDLGAGAGMPGIPLRILWHEGNYTLVEVREKRALFLKTVLASCSIPSTFVFQGRTEIFMPERPCADLVISRAFMPWHNVLDLITPFVAPDGHCLFLTNAPLPNSKPEGWCFLRHHQYTVGNGKRYLWAFTRENTDTAAS